MGSSGRGPIRGLSLSMRWTASAPPGAGVREWWSTASSPPRASGRSTPADAIEPVSGHATFARSARCDRRDLHGDLRAERRPAGQAEVVAAPERARVEPAGVVPDRQQTHGLEGDGDDLRAVDGLQVLVAARPGGPGRAAAEPAQPELDGRGERGAVEAGDRAEDGVLHL